MPKGKAKSAAEKKADTNKKAERFVKIASKRTQTVLNKIRTLGNCGSRATYLYTPEQVTKIFDAIEDALKSAKVRFNTVPTTGAEDDSFKL